MNRVANLRELLEIQVKKLEQVEYEYKHKKKGQVYNARIVYLKDNIIHLSKQLSSFGQGTIRKVLVYSEPNNKMYGDKIYHTIWLDSSITEEEVKSYYAFFNYTVLEVSFKEDLVLGFPRIERK